MPITRCFDHLRQLIRLLALVGAAFAASDAAAQAPPGEESAANPSGRKYPARVYQTVRLQGKAPTIDGRLDDDAWKQGEWSGDFTQQLPTEGAAPSQRTELKILYDDKHLYFAIRAYDDPAKIVRYGSRRDDFDSFSGDIVGICFDSYNSKRTGFEFDLSASGAKVDLILGNAESESDVTWDAVWDGKVALDDQGWTAEFRVPFNQLRYGPQDEQVWGIHAWRWIARNQEEDQWQLIPRQNTGRMHQLGELRGIRGLPKSRHIELLPHVVGKNSSGPSLADGSAASTASGGLDAKVGLTSNFTLDATVNPDFGQVEADPSVINLTAYETFYDEKRPFFLEGRKILTFAIEEEDQLFYSRRIGEAPSYSPSLAAGETMGNRPEGTTILGAFKVTGRTDDGLSLAVLQAFTRKEMVDITSAANSRQAIVEPAGSYTVGRLQKDWDKGNTSLGAMMTSTHRWVSDPTMLFVPTQATTAGVDFTRYFAKRMWVLEASGAASRVSGDKAAILALQRNAVHYYQRDGASHLGVDPERTSMSGHGGSARFGLSDNSRLKLFNHFRWYSPGFDLNEVGYLRQADVMSNQVFLGWSESKPKGLFRNYFFQVGREDQWDFGGLKTRGSTELEASAQFKNKWSLSGQFEYDGGVDTRQLRGGPAVRESDGYGAEIGVSSDSSRRVQLSLEGSRQRTREGGSGGWNGQGTLRLRPSDRLTLSAQASYANETNDLQYVATARAGDAPRWILGRIDQQVWNFTFRVNLAVTPELTVQYYGSPFVAKGAYSAFRRATDTLADAYESRFHRYGAGEIAYRSDDAEYHVTESGSGGSYTFGNPDFSIQEFRSNLVARWEYKPGSSLYVVWSQGRTGYAPTAEGSFGSKWSDLWRSRPDNIFMVKLTYWFSL